MKHYLVGDNVVLVGDNFKHSKSIKIFDPQTMGLKELLALSIYGQPNVKLFRTYEDARRYAWLCKENSRDSMILKPVFTVDNPSDVLLLTSKEKLEKVPNSDGYTAHYFTEFLDLNSCVDSLNFIQAEFFGPDVFLKPVLKETKAIISPLDESPPLYAEIANAITPSPNDKITNTSSESIRYFVVGKQINDIHKHMSSGKWKKSIEARLITSLYDCDILHLFRQYDDAKNYFCINGSFSGCPIFTVELAQNVLLGNLHVENFVHQQPVLDQRLFSSYVDKEVKLSYYLVQASLIEKINIIRAEFSDLKTFEFDHDDHSTKAICTIL